MGSKIFIQNSTPNSVPRLWPRMPSLLTSWCRIAHSRIPVIIVNTSDEAFQRHNFSLYVNSSFHRSRRLAPSWCVAFWRLVSCAIINWIKAFCQFCLQLVRAKRCIMPLAVFGVRCKGCICLLKYPLYSFFFTSTFYILCV